MNKPKFLAVDLDIESKEDLAPLVADLGERAIVLHSGPAEDGNLLSVQSAHDTRTPDSAISAICQMIEALSPPRSPLLGNGHPSDPRCRGRGQLVTLEIRAIS